MGAGRPSVYENKIKARFDEISEWRKAGMTEKSIAKKLGVSWSTFKKYKSERDEFSALLKKSEQEMINSLRGALMKKAAGFQYVEEKKIYERNPDTGELVHVRTEAVTKTALPDVAAINLALKNYDPDNWSNDPQADKFRREELELKKKQSEQNNW